MAYGTTVVVGALCGLIGVTSLTVTNRKPPTAVPSAAPTPVIPARAPTKVVPAVTDDHMPPARVPTELVGTGRGTRFAPVDDRWLQMRVDSRATPVAEAEQTPDPEPQPIRSTPADGERPRVSPRAGVASL